MSYFEHSKQGAEDKNLNTVYDAYGERAAVNWLYRMSVLYPAYRLENFYKLRTEALLEYANSEALSFSPMLYNEKSGVASLPGFENMVEEGNFWPMELEEDPTEGINKTQLQKDRE